MKTNEVIILSKKNVVELKNILRVFTNTKPEYIQEMLIKKGVSKELYSAIPIDDLQSGKLVGGAEIVIPKDSYILDDRQFMAMGHLLYGIYNKDNHKVKEAIAFWDHALPELVAILTAK